MDSVDGIIRQWMQERPDLDVLPMSLIARVLRVNEILKREMTATFARHDLNFASFDVLATLRRSGTPYALSPNGLMEAMMVTSGTMTNRIDRLEKQGLVERARNPNDGRSFIVGLTKEGFRLINKVLDEHVETQRQLVSTLTKKDFKTLNTLLAGYLADLES